MSEERIYEAFIDWLKQSWHLPETEELRPAVRARYSPEEAAFLTGFPHGSTKLSELAELRQMDEAELQPKLEAMAEKGILYRRVRPDGLWFHLNDFFFTFLRSSFWAGRDDEETQVVAGWSNKYYYNGLFDDWQYAHQQGLRTLPIGETIGDMRRVLPYEDVVKVVDSFEYYAVSHCPCRQRKNLDADSPNCEHPTEVCLHFDDLGRYTVENGMGREITREETLEILKEAAASGLVHGVSNWLEGADTICNCCKCCCMWLEQYHVLGHPMSLSPANYRAAGDHATCKACGLCVRRCPMNAQRLEKHPEANNKFGKVSMVTEHKCIGCGVCVYTCPVEALTLLRTAETETPPKDIHEFAVRFMTDVAAGHESKEKAAAKG